MNEQRLKRSGLAVLIAAFAWASASNLWAQQRTGGGGGRTTSNRSIRSTSTGGSSSGTRDYGNNTMVGDATVTSDPETRRLIVVTDDETALNVSNVIASLDMPKPQVLIKVVFLEVTYRNGSDIGVEGAYHSQNGSTKMSILQQFNGMSGINSGNGIYNVMGSDYTVTLRMIAEAGKLEVLSRPSILARNNQQAIITVGQQVPLITGTRYDTFGNQINTISYQDVGIILRVTPFITSDGMVEMIVAPEISNLSDQTVSISSGGTNSVGAPVINVRSADTVVVTPDTQTVIIGGLLQNTKTEAVTKIPVLGDLPLLGAAFRRKVTGNSKTELLIFLTPFIVKTPSLLAGISAAERADTQLVPKAFSSQELDRFLDSLPAKGPVPVPSQK